MNAISSVVSVGMSAGILVTPVGGNVYLGVVKIFERTKITSARVLI